MRIFIVIGLLLMTNLVNAQPFNEKERQVSFRVEISRKVPHDLMQVILFTEEQDKNPTKLAKTITDRLNVATKKARNFSGKINIQTGSRSSTPIYKNKSKEIIAWRERAQLMLESSDFAALSSLTAELMNEIQIERMGFSISKNLRLKLEEELLQEAAKAFMQRGKIVSDALGAKKFDLLFLDLVNRSHYNPTPMRVMSSPKEFSLSYDKAMPKFDIEAGSSDFNFEAGGRIILTF